MAKILLAWELGGGIGHCVKLGPIAAGLQQRGHHVYFAARSVSTAQAICGNAATRFLQAPFLRGPVSRPTRPTCTFAQVLHNSGFGDDGQLRSLVDGWRELIRSVQPAIVLCEHAPTALLACRTEGVPRLVMGSGFSLPPNIAPLPDLRPTPNVSQSELRRVEDGIVHRINAGLAAAGANPIERLSQLFGEVSGRYLMTFAELDHHSTRIGDAYRGCWSLPGGRKPEWPVGDGPRVFAYLKRAAPPWQVERVIYALNQAPVRAIVHIAGAEAHLLSLQTPALRITEDPVDLSAVAAECDAAVMHGTAGATIQLLLGGVPLLLIPLYFEQAIMSVRVAELGAGLVLHPRRVGHVASILGKLLHNGQFRAAATKFASRYAEFDGGAQLETIVSQLDVNARKSE